MTWELQSTTDASGIEWPRLRNHVRCMAHVIHLALGAFMCSLGVNGRTKSWEAHECNQQFGENEGIDIGKRQRLRKEGNARINKVSAMTPGLAKIIEKVCILTYFECTETDYQIAENACCIEYADTWALKPFHWLSKGQCTNHRTAYYGCEDTVEFNTGVAWPRLPIMSIHLLVSQEPKIQLLLAALHNTRWMDHHDICDGSFKAIPVQDAL